MVWYRTGKQPANAFPRNGSKVAFPRNGLKVSQLYNLAV
jgi:hypothetical protein